MDWIYLIVESTTHTLLITKIKMMRMVEGFGYRVILSNMPLIRRASQDLFIM
jgi:hypothetical protein